MLEDEIDKDTIVTSVLQLCGIYFWGVFMWDVFMPHSVYIGFSQHQQAMIPNVESMPHRCGMAIFWWAMREMCTL